MAVKSLPDVDVSVSSVLVASLAASPAGSWITKSPDTTPVVSLLLVPSVSVDSASKLTMLQGTDAACAIPASSAESTAGSATRSATLLAARVMVPPIATARTVTVEVAVVLWREVVLREVVLREVVLLHDAEVCDELAVAECVMVGVCVLVLTDVPDELLIDNVAEVEVNVADVAVVALAVVVPEVVVNVVGVAVVTVLRVAVAVVLEVIVSLFASVV